MRESCADRHKIEQNPPCRQSLLCARFGLKNGAIAVIPWAMKKKVALQAAIRHSCKLA